MTDTSKDAVERLLDGVTPGPWVERGGDICPKTALDDAIVAVYNDTTAPDARFIAASRELVPALLAEREALTSEVARLTAERDYDRRQSEAKSAVIARLTAALAQSRAETQAALAGCVSGEAVAYLHSSDDGRLELVLAQRVNSDTARRRIELGWKSTPLFAAIQPDTSKLAQIREALSNLVNHGAFQDEEYMSEDLVAKLSAARSAIAFITAQEGK